MRRTLASIPPHPAPWLGLVGLVSLALAVGLLPATRADAAERPEDEVRFRVEASREVPNDQAVATIGLSLEGADPAALARRLNEKLAAARARADAVAGIRVASAPASSRPVYEEARIRAWHVQQDLVLESGDAAALAGLVGELQSEGLVLRGLQHRVGEETRAQVEEALVVEALGAMQARADLVAKSLGRGGWTLLAASIDGAGAGPPEPTMRGRVEMVAASAPPVTEAGTTRIRVEVDATIRLAGRP